MATLPESLKIGPYRYRVLLDASIINRNNSGEMCYQALTISIMTGMAPDRVAEVLLHEVLHGVWNIALGDSDVDHKSEDVVSHLAPHLLAALRDNPELVAFLKEPE